MEEMQDHLSMIYKTSTNAQQHFIDKDQDDHIRFVYCGIQKVQKISRTLLMSYYQLEDNDELEFSFGILVRTLLMDMILMLKLKSLIICHNQVSEELKNVVKEFCYSVLVDGAKYELYNIYHNEKITESDKRKYYQIFDQKFPNAFDFSVNKPKLKLTEISLSKFCRESKNLNLNEHERICSLYFYYSKYDHLSHLSSLLPTELSFERRKKMFDSTVVLMVMHLQDLLATACDFNEDYKILFPYIEEIKMHLKTHYS